MAIHYITPAVTPMTPAGQIDFDSCGALYKHLLDGGVDGILVLGSIGEFFGFTMEQKRKLIQYAAQVVNGRTKLIAGTTSLIYDEIVELSRFSLENGMDAVIVIPPYYFHFNDESVYSYYASLAADIPGKLYLYNFPDRTGYSISPAVVRTLAERFENIVGIKDTISGMDHTRELIKAVRPVRPDFRIYSGFDDNFVHNILSGGDGCIAGLSNLYPELTSAWASAVREGWSVRVKHIQEQIDCLMDIYTVGKPFVPFIKEALVMKEIIRYSAATMPMPSVTQEQRNALSAVMERYSEVK